MIDFKTCRKTLLEPESPFFQHQLSSKCESLVLQDITKNTQKRKKQCEWGRRKIVERENIVRYKANEEL